MKHSDFEDDFYDSIGNLNPNGLYDAEGHIIAERVVEWLEYIRDTIDDIAPNKEQQ